MHITGLRITVIPGNSRFQEREFGNEMPEQFQTSGFKALVFGQCCKSDKYMFICGTQQKHYRWKQKRGKRVTYQNLGGNSQGLGGRQEHMRIRD